jgi:hypothetical protein
VLFALLESLYSFLSGVYTVSQIGHILMSRGVAKQIACRKNLFTLLVPVWRRLAEFEDIYSGYFFHHHHPLSKHLSKLIFPVKNRCYLFSVFHFGLFYSKNGRYSSGVCHYVLFHPPKRFTIGSAELRVVILLQRLALHLRCLSKSVTTVA